MARFLDVLIAALNGAMMWTTLAGVGDIAAGRNRPDLTRRAVPLRSAYVVLVAISLILSLTVEGSSCNDLAADRCAGRGDDRRDGPDFAFALPRVAGADSITDSGDL